MESDRLIRESSRLPASAIAGAVNDALRENRSLVITAPPGAGKSTLLPLTILEALPSDGKILMLEPRRVAARQIAGRMAWLLGEEVGETVGYRIRFESKVSRKTRLEVLTEGILTRIRRKCLAVVSGMSTVICARLEEGTRITSVHVSPS